MRVSEWLCIGLEGPVALFGIQDVENSYSVLGTFDNTPIDLEDLGCHVWPCHFQPSLHLGLKQFLLVCS